MSDIRTDKILISVRHFEIFISKTDKIGTFQEHCTSRRPNLFLCVVVVLLSEEGSRILSKVHFQVQLYTGNLKMDF